MQCIMSRDARRGDNFMMRQESVCSGLRHMSDASTAVLVEKKSQNEKSNLLEFEDIWYSGFVELSTPESLKRRACGSRAEAEAFAQAALRTPDAVCVWDVAAKEVFVCSGAAMNNPGEKLPERRSKVVLWYYGLWHRLPSCQDTGAQAQVLNFILSRIWNEVKVVAKRALTEFLPELEESLPAVMCPARLVGFEMGSSAPYFQDLRMEDKNQQYTRGVGLTMHIDWRSSQFCIELSLGAASTVSIENFSIAAQLGVVLKPIMEVAPIFGGPSPACGAPSLHPLERRRRVRASRRALEVVAREGAEQSAPTLV